MLHACTVVISKHGWPSHGMFYDADLRFALRSSLGLDYYFILFRIVSVDPLLARISPRLNRTPVFLTHFIGPLVRPEHFHTRSRRPRHPLGQPAR